MELASQLGSYEVCGACVSGREELDVYVGISVDGPYSMELIDQ